MAGHKKHFPDFVGPADASRWMEENPEYQFDFGRPTRAGEIGYWASLINTFKYISEHETPMIIFEDDAEPIHSFIYELDNYLHSMKGFLVEAFQLYTPYDRVNPNAPETSFHHAYIRSMWHEWPLGAIMVWPTGARKILRRAQLEPITVTGDVFVTKLGRAGIVQIYSPGPWEHPPVNIQHGSIPSTIDNTPLLTVI